MKTKLQNDGLWNEVDEFYSKAEETLEKTLFRLKKHHNAIAISQDLKEQQQILLSSLGLLQQGTNADILNVVNVVLELGKRSVTENPKTVQDEFKKVTSEMS